MEALTGVMNTIVAYLPSVPAALGILLVGWLIARLLRRLVAGPPPGRPATSGGPE